MKRLLLLGCVACTLGLLGCATDDTMEGEMAGDTLSTMDGMNDGMSTGRMDQGAVRSQIDAANARFEQYMAAQQYDSLTALYTSDAQVMAPNMPVITGADLTSAFEGMGEMGIASVDLQTDELEVADDFAYEVGTYTLGSADGTEVDQGKYIVIWRMEDGEWKIHRDMFNSNMEHMDPNAPPGASADTTRM